jgi:hypothetical protein
LPVPEGANASFPAGTSAIKLLLIDKLTNREP